MRIPPVEPLSEARWNRIERGVFSELDAETAPVAPPRKKAPRRGWLLAGSFAVAASVAAFVGVRTFAGAEREIPVSHVQTGDGESTLTVGDSVIRVAKESAIVVDGDAKRGVLLVLDRGTVSCNVAPRSGRPAYVVQAGNVRVRVVGTAFRVTRAVAGAKSAQVAGKVGHMRADLPPAEFPLFMADIHPVSRRVLADDQQFFGARRNQLFRLAKHRVDSAAD